jgi:mono/diheme cytochrome c family protein
MIRKKKKFQVLGGAAIFLGLTFNTSSFADDIGKGMTLYQSTCLQCHGEKGDGTGPEGVNYNLMPTDFTSSKMYTLTDSMIEKTVVAGIPTVSAHAWGDILSNADVAAVIRYIRTFQK